MGGMIIRGTNTETGRPGGSCGTSSFVWYWPGLQGWLCRDWKMVRFQLMTNVRKKSSRMTSRIFGLSTWRSRLPFCIDMGSLEESQVWRNFLLFSLPTFGWLWMASSTQWMWVWANSRRWWWTGKPDGLPSVGLQRIGHNWWTPRNHYFICSFWNSLGTPHVRPFVFRLP